MTKTDLQREVLRLPVEDQLELAEAIWDRVEHAAPQPPLPDGQRSLLDELVHLSRDPSRWQRRR